VTNLIKLECIEVTNHGLANLKKYPKTVYIAYGLASDKLILKRQS